MFGFLNALFAATVLPEVPLAGSRWVDRDWPEMEYEVVKAERSRVWYRQYTCSALKNPTEIQSLRGFHLSFMKKQPASRLQRGSPTLELLVCMLLITGTIAFCALVASVTCATRWSHSGMQSQWLPFVGCQVQLKDGTWVPDKTIRTEIKPGEGER